jgi:hypothetical protein
MANLTLANWFKQVLSGYYAQNLTGYSLSFVHFLRYHSVSSGLVLRKVSVCLDGAREHLINACYNCSSIISEYGRMVSGFLALVEPFIVLPLVYR